MTTAVIALVAALAAMVVAGLVAAAGRRTRAVSETRVTSALREMGARMDELARELTSSIERLHDDARRSRAVDALGQSLDLDEVLARVTDAAAALPGAAASVVHVHPGDGEPLVAASGLDGAMAAAQEITGPPDGSRVRAVALSYHYPAADEPDDPLRSAIAVPLEVDGQAVGFLAVYARGEGSPVGPDDFGTLEAIASHAGPAIENARHFGEAQRLAALDPLTGLANRSTFHDTLAQEVARARRYQRRLAVLVLDLDDFKNVNDRIGHIAGDTVLTELATVVRESARTSDIPCRIGGDELAVILPESGRVEAEGLFARVQATLRRVPPVDASGLTVSGGIAEIERDDDAVSLFERADAALQRAKRNGKGTAA
jgi:two-component system, cell cycle response regulator